MLDIQLIRTQIELVKERLAARGFEFDTEMVFKKELSKIWTKKRMNEFKLNYKKRYSQKIYFTYEEKS